MNGRDLARVAWNETWSVIAQVIVGETAKLALPGSWERLWWSKRRAAQPISDIA